LSTGTGETTVGAGLLSAEIGIFGGTGFYSFAEEVTDVDVQTPYGPPSAPLAVGEVAGRRVAFLARHGRRHELPAHKVNYRANLWAMRRLGVSRLLGPCAVGSLRAEIRPGDFVVCDQLVDRTRARADTFFDGPLVNSVSFADPYCPELRAVVAAAGESEGIVVHRAGTVVVIQGPRFSTRAESRWFASAGWDVVNMTQYPEALLARELGICYSGIALVTDYDAGVEGADHAAVTMEEVLRVLAGNVEAVRAVLHAAVALIPPRPTCGCADQALDPGSFPT